MERMSAFSDIKFIEAYRELFDFFKEHTSEAFYDKFVRGYEDVSLSGDRDEIHYSFLTNLRTAIRDGVSEEEISSQKNVFDFLIDRKIAYRRKPQTLDEALQGEYRKYLGKYNAQVDEAKEFLQKIPFKSALKILSNTDNQIMCKANLSGVAEWGYEPDFVYRNFDLVLYALRNKLLKHYGKQVGIETLLTYAGTMYKHKVYWFILAIDEAQFIFPVYSVLQPDFQLPGGNAWQCTETAVGDNLVMLRFYTGKGLGQNFRIEEIPSVRSDISFPVETEEKQFGLPDNWFSPYVAMNDSWLEAYSELGDSIFKLKLYYSSQGSFNEALNDFLRYKISGDFREGAYRHLKYGEKVIDLYKFVKGDHSIEEDLKGVKIRECETF